MTNCLFLIVLPNSKFDICMQWHKHPFFIRLEFSCLCEEANRQFWSTLGASTISNQMFSKWYCRFEELTDSLPYLIPRGGFKGAGGEDIFFDFFWWYFSTLYIYLIYSALKIWRHLRLTDCLKRHLSVKRVQSVRNIVNEQTMDLAIDGH